MLFVPDEDYIRLPDHTTNATTATATATAAAAAADADADADDDVDNNEAAEDGEVFDENAVVSPSILFASQAQYLGHSDQVRTSASEVTTLWRYTNMLIIIYRAMLCIRGTSHGPVSVCPSVRLSVTSRSSTKTDKRRITQIAPHDTPGTLVF